MILGTLDKRTEIPDFILLRNGGVHNIGQKEVFGPVHEVADMAMENLDRKTVSQTTFSTPRKASLLVVLGLSSTGKPSSEKRCAHKTPQSSE